MFVCSSLAQSGQARSARSLAPAHSTRCPSDLLAPLQGALGSRTFATPVSHGKEGPEFMAGRATPQPQDLGSSLWNAERRHLASLPRSSPGFCSDRVGDCCHSGARKRWRPLDPRRAQAAPAWSGLVYWVVALICFQEGLL